jgi:predicted acylesterase/phospholipase RssA
MMEIYGKTALVLAGGGLTGAVYEIGALRAIDDLLLDRTINDFDIYVGTSAGALVASFIASGISPETMLQVIDGTKKDVSSVERKHIYNFNFVDYLSTGAKLPIKLVESWAHYLRHIQDMTIFDMLWSLSEALPSGLYDSKGLATFVKQGLSDFKLSDNFDDLGRELYIIATDLDTGERAIFGSSYHKAPISLAVAASSALPVVYKPVRIGDKDFIDGGMRGTASIDLAIERGATLVVVINPLVPFDNHPENQVPTNIDDKQLYISEKGVQSIANQTARIMLHSGLHYHIKQTRRAHPEVDIILIEPKPKDYQMFLYNIMRYSARLIVARHGFESVTIDLAEDYDKYKATLARHGIPISRRLVIEELAEISASDYDPKVIRRILEARDTRCGQGRKKTPFCRLTATLAKLEIALDQLS